ncbi:MAG: hypothetical protein Q9M40_10680 [Sulfurimonas sp.]|nr:hypothetical protein [Sulfurimonas sp.]
MILHILTLQLNKKAHTSLQTLSTAAINANDHGTACAGIIAGLSDNNGIVGIAPHGNIGFT